MNAPAGRPQFYRFGVFEIDTLAHELRRQGMRIRLQEQPYQLLLILLDRNGQVVTREELRQALWPSSVFVDFDHGLNNAIARLREALGDAAATPRFIETVPRLGYRFIHPVTVVTEPSAQAPQAEAASDAPLANESPPISSQHASPRRWTRAHLVGSVVIAAVGALALLLVFRGHDLTSPEVSGPTALPADPSVAVLPFVSLSEDKESEYFADGLSEELLNRLATMRGLKVAAQTSSFYFKGKNQPVAQIAAALQVNHLLEGSVRRSGARLRVTAQLVDARDGYHRWSQTFDRDFTDIFQIQEEIAIAVANALQVKLLDAEQQGPRDRGTRDAEAYRDYLIARAQISWLYGRPDWAVIKRSYQNAIARDPNFAAAHAGLAHYYFNRERDENGIRTGMAAAERAVALAPQLSEALGARANFEFLQYEAQGDYKAYARAQSDFRRALELDPANSQATFHYARAMTWTDPDLALSLAERTLQLDPLRFTAVGVGAFIMNMQGRHEAALKRAWDLYESHPEQRFHIAIQLANLAYYQGRLDEAVVYLREALPRGDVGPPAAFWALYMSLGDREAAHNALDVPANRTSGRYMSDAARLVMDDDYDAAFALLDEHRSEFPMSRALDVAAARLASLAGEPERARVILEARLPDLVTAVEPINAHNVGPALDLAAAWASTGQEARARSLLTKITAFLDGPAAPRLPQILVMRARVHAMAGETNLAQQVLDRAYDAGFRMICDFNLLAHTAISCVEAEPAFATLRSKPHFKSWIERIKADNSQQLERLRARDAKVRGT